MSDDAAAAFTESLEELTFNSKPIINSLTMIADEEQAHAAALVHVIQQTIHSRPADKKLPVMYLLDSITKNVGGAYIKHFASGLPDLVQHTFAASGPKVKTSIQALVRTWKGVFPSDVVAEVGARIAATTAAPSATISTGPVHAGGPPPGGAPAKRSSAAADSASAVASKRARGDAGAAGDVTADGDGDPATAAARSELAQLDQRIISHLRAELPADAQLLSFTGRACALYGSILAANPPDGQILSAKLLEAQRLQAQIQFALDPTSAPPPAGPSLLLPAHDPNQQGGVGYPPHGGAPPPTHLHPMMQPPPIPPPPPQQLSAIPPPPGGMVPPPPPPGGLGGGDAADGANSSAPAVDVSKLLASLAKAGVLKGAAGAGTVGGSGGGAPGAPPPPPQALPSAGEDGGFSGAPSGLQDVLHRLHGARPMQCKTCGVRFGASQREELRVHMDFHFRRNRRGTAAAGGAPASRKWMLPLAEWVRYVFDESDEGAGRQPASIFDPIDRNGSSAQKSATEVQPPKPVLRAPSDVSRVACALCGEAIEMFYDDAAMEWMMRDAVPMKDGSGAFAHSACMA